MHLVKSVNNLSCGQGQNERGYKLKQTHQTQVPSASRDFVHVPRQGHHQHLCCQDARQTSQPKTHKGLVRQQVAQRRLSSRIHLS